MFDAGPGQRVTLVAMATLLVLVLLVLLVLLVAYLLRKLFSLLATLWADLGQRAGKDLRTVEAAGLPSEVHSFAAAI